MLIVASASIQKALLVTLTLSFVGTLQSAALVMGVQLCVVHAVEEVDQAQIHRAQTHRARAAGGITRADLKRLVRERVYGSASLPGGEEDPARAAMEAIARAEAAWRAAADA